MSAWLKVALITSVCLFLFFIYRIHKINTHEFVAESAYLAPLTLPTPLVRKDVEFEELAKNLPTDRQFFRQVFFEVMNLRGMQQNRSGTWLAIFADGKDNLVCLEPGDVYDGVKIESASKQGCIARYGNIERSFLLP